VLVVPKSFGYAQKKHPPLFMADLYTLTATCPKRAAQTAGTASGFDSCRRKAGECGLACLEYNKTFHKGRNVL